MIQAILLTTGWLFWGILAVIILIDVLALSTEDEGMGAWAIFLTMAGAILSIGFTDAFIGVQLAWLAVGFALYAMLGVVWSFKKWVDFVKAQKILAPSRDRPKAADNKTRIVTSMALWPFQFTWWVLTWPRHFFSWAYTRLSTVFDRITDHIWDSK